MNKTNTREGKKFKLDKNVDSIMQQIHTIKLRISMEKRLPITLLCDRRLTKQNLKNLYCQLRTNN